MSTFTASRADLIEVIAKAINPDRYRRGDWHQARREGELAIAAIEERGWVVVPAKQSDEMYDAGRSAIRGIMESAGLVVLAGIDPKRMAGDAQWSAMLSASPFAPKTSDDTR